MAKSELGGVIINPLADLVKLQIEQNDLVLDIINAEAENVFFDSCKVAGIVFNRNTELVKMRLKYRKNQDELRQLYEKINI